MLFTGCATWSFAESSSGSLAHNMHNSGHVQARAIAHEILPRARGVLPPPAETLPQILSRLVSQVKPWLCSPVHEVLRRLIVAHANVDSPHVQHLESAPASQHLESAPARAARQRREHDGRSESSGSLEADNPHDYAPEWSDGRREGSANEAAANVAIMRATAAKGPAVASWKRRAGPSEPASPARERSTARLAVTATALAGSHACPGCALFLPDALAHGGRAPLALLCNATSPPPPVLLQPRAGEARELPPQNRRPSSAQARSSPRYRCHAPRVEVAISLKEANPEKAMRRPKGFRPVLGLQQLQLWQQQQHELTSSLKAAASIYRASPRFAITWSELRTQPVKRRHAREQLLPSRYYM